MTTVRRSAPGGERAVVSLAAALRAEGVTVGTGQVLACVRALAELDPDDLVDRYWAGRLCLVADPADLVTYDRVFRALLLDGGELSGPVHQTELADLADLAEPGASAASGPNSRVPRAGQHRTVRAGTAASDRERMLHRRFDRATSQELAVIDRLLRQIEVAVPHRRMRRMRSGGRGELDLGRTLDRALETDGELFDRAWRTRERRPRPLVLLLDVSGSMAPQARPLLSFALAARRTARREHRRRVEVFAFGTRLTRLTEALSRRDPDEALERAAAEVADWHGGTRIGASLNVLVRSWAGRGLLRGAVVVVCSDGLERGSPAQLERAVARLSRHAHRIVWVNPLAGDPRYEPSQRGMAAALPHVDVFLPGHDLASLEGLAEAIAAAR